MATQWFSQTPAPEGEWWVDHIHASHLKAEQWAGYRPLKTPNFSPPLKNTVAHLADNMCS